MTAPGIHTKPLTDLQARVLDVVSHRALTVGSVTSHVNATRGQTMAALNVLVRRGLVASEAGRYHRRNP